MTIAHLIEGADRAAWTSTTRSLRIDGVVTSIRLENFFWQTLEEIGTQSSTSVPQLLQRLHDQSQASDYYHLTNFASFLRVCCGLYLRQGSSPDD